MSTIDDTWEEMKKEAADDVRRLGRKKKNSRKGTKKMENEKKRPPVPEVKPKSNPSGQIEPTPDVIKDSILAWSLENNLIRALGDSDDESGDEDGGHGATVTSAPGRSWSINRFSTASSSSDVNTRLEGLTALHLAIDELLSTVEKIPQLDLPPPYERTRIALTHREQGTLVSDMALDRWSQWNRTHTPLMSQFRCSGEHDPASRVSDDPKNATAIRQLQALLNGCGCSIFRRFGDKVEKCRAFALRCVGDLSLAGIDFGKHIGLLMPAVFARFPPVSFDAEMNVFVHNAIDHDCHRRGGAVARQDRYDTRTVSVVETSEEVRRAMCDLISFLIRGAMARDALSTLDPYFTDLVLALYTNLRDPCPDVKVRSSQLLTQVLRIPHWEPGAKHFALAVARAAIPHLRHRNSKVRLAAVELFEASVCVPNREKLKGAGSDGIKDLIGFKEDNVLPIAGYYKAQCSVAVNTLAELAIDNNAKVRERVCEMLAYFIVCLPDRFDHQTRILPYVLNLYLDPVESIRQRAMDAVKSLGAQYEAEHPEDIIERRQYGIDGDSSCNYSDNLPHPFESRPGLGERLFVRSNTRRFLTALLVELSSWRSKTREQSAKLLRILIIYNEEHLVGSLSKTLPLIVKGLQLAISDVKGGDNTSVALVESLGSCLQLMGRYIDPDVFVPLLTKDGGTNHSEAYSAVLRFMMMGSKYRNNKKT